METSSSKSLWNLMRQGDDVAPAPEESPPDDETQDEVTGTSRGTRVAADGEDPDLQPKSLWAVMTGDVQSAARPHKNNPIIVPLHSRPAAPRRSAGAVITLCLGAAAVPLAVLAMLPEFWFRFPATVTGVAALVCGVVALRDLRRSRGRQTGGPLALAGMLLGIASLFLGPMLRERSDQEPAQTGSENAGPVRVDSSDYEPNVLHQLSTRNGPTSTMESARQPIFSPRRHGDTERIAQDQEATELF